MDSSRKLLPEEVIIISCYLNSQRSSESLVSDTWYFIIFFSSVMVPNLPSSFFFFFFNYVWINSDWLLLPAKTNSVSAYRLFAFAIEPQNISRMEP